MKYIGDLFSALFIIMTIFIPINAIAKEEPTKKTFYYMQLPAKSASEVGEQLYLALLQQRFHDAEKLLSEYQQLPEHEQLLVDYTKAVIFQHQGNWLQSEYYYLQQLKEKPDFIPAKTGLIKLYIDIGEVKKAKIQLNELSQFKNLPSVINQNIQIYSTQLANFYQGYRFYEIGLIYSDNVNKMPHYAGELVSQNAIHRVYRYTQKPVSSLAQSHFFSFYQPYIKRAKYALSSDISFHTVDYFSYRTASFLSLYTQLNYQYLLFNYKGTFSPYYKLKSDYSEFEYQQYGIRHNLFYPLNNKHAINLSSDYSKQKYRRELNNLNGYELSQQLSYQYKINPYLLLINQITYQLKNKKNDLLNSQQYGIKTGVHYQPSQKWNFALHFEYTVEHYRKYNPFLNEKRKDHSFLLTTKIKKQTPILLGFYPMAEFRYIRNLSNVSWLYQYQTYELLFKLEKNF